MNHANPSLSSALIAVLSQAADCFMSWETVELGQTSPGIPWKFVPCAKGKDNWQWLLADNKSGHIHTSPRTKWTLRFRHDRDERDCWLLDFVPFVLKSLYNSGLCCRKSRFLRLSTFHCIIKCCHSSCWVRVSVMHLCYDPMPQLTHFLIVRKHQPQKESQSFIL